jgi:glycerol-3-phosphate dehydrogenase (NAD(P)+)
MTFERIGVIGAGAWGTALAGVAVRAGRRVSVWDHDSEILSAIRTRRENPKLPGMPVDERIAVADTLEDAASRDAVLLVVPAQVLRQVVIAAAPFLRRGVPVVACAKGIERGSRKFMTDVIAESAAQVIPAILSGPSFAIDVARGLPTAVTVAAPDEAIATALSQALGSPTFRTYHATDVRGVEIGGAAKNVLAIAAGIVTGKQLGASAAAALTTRGFAELVRFGKALGARPETMMGLSGLGDLILTCSSPQSRNFSLGVALGQGQSLDDVLREGKLAEGAYTAAVLVELAAEHGVEMPISGAVAAVLDGRLSVDAAIEALLARPIGAEG